MRLYAPVLFFLFLTGLFASPATLPAQTKPPASTQPPPDKAALDELERLYSTGVQAYNKGDFPAALKIWQAGLEKAQAIKAEAKVATFLINIGNAYNYLAQLEKALDFYQRALRISEKSGNERQIAMSLDGIGMVYDTLGQADKALDFYQRALKLQEKSGNERDIAISLNNIGVVYLFIGQNEKALDFCQRALNIYEKIGDQEGISASLNNIGNLYYNLGQQEKALNYYQRSLQLKEKTGNPQDSAASLGNIGSVYKSLGQYEKALDYHQRALKLFEKGGNEQEIAGSLNNIGTAHALLGQNEKALNYYQRSLQLDEKTGNPQDIAASLNNIGSIYNDLGQQEKALDYHLRSLKLKESVGNSQDIAGSLNSIGNVYNDLRQYEKAEAFFLRGLGVFEKYCHDILTDPAQLGDLLATTFLYQSYASFLTERNRSEDALPLIERNRALGLSLQVGINQANLTRFFTREESIQLRTLKTEAVLNARSFAVLQSRPIPASLPEQSTYNTRYREAEENRQKAVQRYELFRDTLYTRHPQFQLVQGERTRTIREFKSLSRNNPDTLYLEYANMREKTLLLALHNGVLTSKVLPLKKQSFEELVSKWRDAIQRQDTTEARLAQELYRAILLPLQSLLDRAGVKRLVVVADGMLLDVPFAALRDKSGRRLIERFAVSNALSLGILLWPENPDLPTKGLLCIADTRGETPRSPSATLTRGGFGALPSARKEGETIASLYPKSSALLIGGQATETVVKKEMGKFALLHFAVHGDLNTKSGLRSALLLAVEPPGSENDGFLDGSEIVGIGVTAKLAVLSACQSGQGKKCGGEGLMGLAWAFQAAGCSSVVASQWQVDDLATKDLMLAFYRGLKAGKRKDDALREAMLLVMHNGNAPKSSNPVPKSPYYWAAFQVIGKTERLK